MIKAVLTNQIVAKLIAIEKNKDALEQTDIPVSLSSKLRKLTWKKSSYASNKIEGNPLTYEQADQAIEEMSRHTLKPEQEIQNYYLALSYLSEQLKKKEPFSLSLLLATQKIIVKGESKEKAGIRGPMPAGVLFAVYDSNSGNPEYIPPEAKDVKGLLDELVDYVNTSDDHPIIKSAILHYQLVTIHPFEDGNGRSARIMANYLLSYYGYGFKNVGSLEEYFAYDLDEYYSSLQMGLPPLYYEGRNNPPHPEIWLNYYLKIFSLYAEKAIQTSIQQVKGQKEIRLSHLSIKAKTFLSYLQQNKIDEFTPIEMAKQCKVTNRTIINWCAELSKNDFLEPLLIHQRIRGYKLK